MSDDLEQAEVAEAAPEPVAAPEPAVESEPEAQEFHYEPEFLNDDPIPQEPAPEAAPQQEQWSPQQVAEYNYQQQQQYQPPPQHQENPLDGFVRNPYGVIDGRSATIAQQIAQQAVNQNVAPVVQQTQRLLDGQAEYHANVAKGKIKNMYDGVFNKDETFASNEVVRNYVNTTLAGDEG